MFQIDRRIYPHPFEPKPLQVTLVISERLAA